VGIDAEYPALQINPALLYFWSLSLTFTAQKRRLFVRKLGNTQVRAIALVRHTLREQVSGGLLINQDLNRRRRIKIFKQKRKYILT